MSAWGARKAKLVLAAGVEWPHNSSRHSFCSYHLAKFQDVNKLRSDMGHATTDLIFSNYRAVVSPAKGEKYFAISPKQAENVVAMRA